MAAPFSPFMNSMIVGVRIEKVGLTPPRSV